HQLLGKLERARDILLGEADRLVGDVPGALAGGLGVALECRDGIVRRHNVAVEGLPRLGDALFRECSHFRGNFEAIGGGHAHLLMSRGKILLVGPAKVVRLGGCGARQGMRPNSSVARIAGEKMRIVDIRECAIPLNSNIRNSSIDFSEMTTSVVAVITDVMREGAPVAGFAFNSTARYACGAALRARFIPRILAADPEVLLDEREENFAPAKVLAAMMQREKSGGHSERSIAIGTIEVAVWDAVAKIAGKPLHRLLAERYNN